MATNELEAPPKATPLETISKQMGLKVHAATDTQHSGITLRIWLIIVGLAAVVSTANMPFNVVGAVLIAALALSLGSRSRIGGVR